MGNESNEPVYFDDFKVTDTRGRIIEEDHYYAFGLKIAGISSVKFGDPNEGMLNNKNLYNDKELFDDADLNWYDYGFRNYDAQIGRFTQLDPLTDEYPELTPYQYASDEPIANVDMDGLESYQSLTPVVVQGLSRTAPAATNAGVNIFKISTRIIPTLTNIAAVHSEQSSVNSQLQASIQFQTGMEARKENLARIKLKERVEAMERVDEMTKDGLWDPNLSDEEARTNFLNLSVGLTLPNAFIRPATILLNANKIGSAVENGLIKVYRVFGGRSQQFGESWTTVNPKFFGQGYRNLSGLPNTNDGSNIVEGFVKWSDIDKVRPSLPLDGNSGGLPEVIIKNSAKKIIDPTTVTLKTRF